MTRGHFAPAIHHGPPSAQAYYKLGLALETRKTIGLAIALDQQALRLNPVHEDAKQQLRALGALPSE